MNWKKLAKTSLITLSIVVSAIANADPTWIDVRSEREHKVDSIEGDVRINHVDIVEQVGELFPDKSTELNLYCRSGGRAGKAMTALQNAGYSNITNAGGIDEARRTRGLLNK